MTLKTPTKVDLLPYQTNHILHLLLSIATGGLWLIVWFFVAASDREMRNAMTDAGNFKPKTPPRSTFEKNIIGMVLVFLVIVIVFMVLISTVFADEILLNVPSDSSGKYFILERGDKDQFKTIVTKRIGTSSVSFSKRIYDCENKTTKYLGTGDSLEAMSQSNPDPQMGPILEGSIAYYVGLEACK